MTRRSPITALTHLSEVINDTEVPYDYEVTHLSEVINVSEVT